MKTFKKVLHFAVLAILLIGLYIPKLYAATDVNGEGDDGNQSITCSSGMSVCWSRVSFSGGVGNDFGIRATVVEVDEEGNYINSLSTNDFSNTLRTGYSFISKSEKKWSKLSYVSGTPVSVYSGYEAKVISPALPWLVNGSTGENNFEEIREYFISGYGTTAIADSADLNCDSDDYCELLETYDNGESKYKILIEPVAYVVAKFPGKSNYVNVAMTPTEMALYDEQYGQFFFYSAPNLMYSTFAKAMYLQEDAIGFIAQAPTAATWQSTSHIIDYLGMSVISFGDAPEEEGEIGGPIEVPGQIVITGNDATYRYNTDVFTSIMLRNTSSENFNKGNEVTIKMVLQSSGQTLCTTKVQVPAFESQLAYCQWKTPNKVAQNKDKITVYEDGVAKSYIDITYQSIYGKEPPDTNADDTKPRGWTVPSVNLSELNNGVSSSNSWKIWFSENNHYEGTLTGILRSYSNLGSEVTLYYDEYKTRYKITDYCTGTTTNADGTTTTYPYACGWHWSSWSSPTKTEYVEENTANEYYFYRYGSYYVENVTKEKEGCGSNDSYCRDITHTEYIANPDTSKPYYDTMTVTITSFNDAKITPQKPGDPDGTDRYIKSGYGLNAYAKASYSTNLQTTPWARGTSGYTAIHTGMQHVVATFPEFQYVTYQRVLDVKSGNVAVSASTSGSNEYQFAVNPADRNGFRTHFTPIWYPDNRKYTIKFRLMDFWTPAGMLQYYDSDDITIKGSMWDDIGVTNGGR